MALRAPSRQLMQRVLPTTTTTSIPLPCAKLITQSVATPSSGREKLAVRPSEVGALLTGKLKQQLVGVRAYHAVCCSGSYMLTQPPAQARLKHGGKKGGKGGKGGGKSQKGGASAEDISLDDIAGIPETKARYDKVLEGLKHEFQSLRGGKTDPAMLDHIQVDSYGAKTNLSAVAQASLKGPQMLVLTVYDPGMTKAVEEAIRDCDMNLNPLVEGQGQVNVPIPKPTKESREAVVKVASKATEKAKVVLRGIRHKVLDQIKKNKDSFPEDDVHLRTKEIDKCTQDAEATAGKLFDSKKKDIMLV